MVAVAVALTMEMYWLSVQAVAQAAEVRNGAERELVGQAQLVRVLLAEHQ
jgi:hypothetical protein